MRKFCKNCGTSISENALFCAACGTAVGIESSSRSKSSIPKERHVKKLFSKVHKKPSFTGGNAFSSNAKDMLFQDVVAAPVSGGEIAFSQPFSSREGITGTELSPFKHLFGGMLGFLKGYRKTVKDKKKLAAVLALSSIWILLNLLIKQGINSFPVRFLSFLTFAQGGLTGGTMGAVGGIIGKGVFAYFSMGLISSLFSGKNPFKGMGNGIKTLFSSFSSKNGNLSTFLMGGGIALLLYNFMAGRAVLSHSMVGIASFFVMLRALGNKYGFLRSFFTTLLSKKNKFGGVALVQSIMTGITAGFALSVPISLIPFSYPGGAYIGYIAGVSAIVFSLVLIIVKTSKKEAVK